MPDTIAYKILTADQWAALTAGTFTGTPLDHADGFVHLCTAAQLAETLDLHFAGQAALVIAAIDIGRFGDAVRWEVSRHGQRFPHLYAPLTADSVVTTVYRSTDPGGQAVPDHPPISRHSV